MRSMQAWTVFTGLTVSILVAVGGVFLVPMAAAAAIPQWPKAALIAELGWLVAMIWCFDRIFKRLSLPPDYQEVARGSNIEVIAKKHLGWRDDYMIITAIVFSEGGRGYSSETRDMLVPKSMGEQLELRARYELQGSSFVPK